MPSDEAELQIGLMKSVAQRLRVCVAQIKGPDPMARAFALKTLLDTADLLETAAMVQDDARRRAGR